MPLKRPALSKISAVVSDIHFPDQHEKCWNSFKSWVDHTRPANLYVNGDVWDFEMLSSFNKNKKTVPHIVDEMREGIKELNWLRQRVTGEMIIILGNHEDRWSKKMNEAFGVAGKGLLGLGLIDQLYAQGLDRNILVKSESNTYHGAKCAQFLVRHGANQSGRFGGGKNVAMNRIDKTMGVSEINGHFHKGQMVCKTFSKKTSIAIINPCMTIDHDYCINPDWQRGFTIVEENTKTKHGTPVLIIMDNDGSFSYGGRTFSG